MSVILWKIIIVSIILFQAIIGSFLGWRVVALIKRVKQLQEERNTALQEWYKVQREKPTLDAFEKKMILNAFNLSQCRGAMENPKTGSEIRKRYKALKEKLKESIKD